MDDARPNDGEDDFSTVYDSVFGEFDPNIDYIRATNKNDHYEQLWVADFARQIKTPPRTLFMVEKVVESNRNKLRNKNDFVRDSIVRAFHWRYQQEKNNPVLSSELELELREMKLQAKLALVERELLDDMARRDGIMRILSTPYSVSVEMIANEQISALKNQDYIVQCRRKLEDFCGRHGR